MSYDLSLIDPKTGQLLHLEQPHHMRGGTYAVGGTTQASLNITYNYYSHFERVFEPLAHAHPRAPKWMHEDWEPRDRVTGIRTLYGLTGAESLPVLDKAIWKLGDDEDPDYWKPTEGNAKRALWNLFKLAAMCPDGVWTGD